MAKTCQACSRCNPDEARFCYFDGAELEGGATPAEAAGAGSQPFPMPFHLGNGTACHNFDEMVTACLDDWQAALDALQFGAFLIFFGTIGRPDLAQAADNAGKFPDRERGLDQLLAKLPSKALGRANLVIETKELQFGPLAPGQDTQGGVRLTNAGKRQVQGTISTDCGWLSFGSPPGVQSKMFQFGQELVMPVLVRGKLLRARNKPLEANIIIETSDGNTETIPVRVNVPVKPFPEGALAGALSPRQLATKAVTAPRAAAALFEGGAVVRWYHSNGWTYPVRHTAPSGLGAVQQYFEALGLVPPPGVDVNQKAISLNAAPHSTVQHVLGVKTRESRPVWALASSNQPWLEIGRGTFAGRTGLLPITVRTGAQKPGEKLLAAITVLANGNQKFVVPVTVTIVAAPPTQRVQARPAATGPHAVAARPAARGPAAVSTKDAPRPAGPGGPPATPHK